MQTEVSQVDSASSSGSLLLHRETSKLTTPGQSVLGLILPSQIWELLVMDVDIQNINNKTNTTRGQYSCRTAE